MEWRPATVDGVKEIVKRDLAECDDHQIATFRQYSIEPSLVSIVRNGIVGSVVVVARTSNEVIYWEDIEEGFNVSPIGTDGSFLEHWCNQDGLRFALNFWIEGREREAT
jgi:hypothetical protein